MQKSKTLKLQKQKENIHIYDRKFLQYRNLQQNWTL